jgi:type II secretory pathway pseudopilin PulG
MKTNNTSAFTLLELLIVLTGIGIVVGAIVATVGYNR